MAKLSGETLKEALEQYLQTLQMNYYFSGQKQINGATLFWNDKIKDVYWNYAAKVDVKESDVKSLIKKVISFYNNKNCIPEFYITDFAKPKNFSDILENTGFKTEFTDAWMFYEKETVDIPKTTGFEMKEARTENDMSTFINVFNKVYGATSTDDVYQGLPEEYGQCLFEAFKNPENKGKITNYLGMLNGKPVGTATLVVSKRFALVTNIAVLQEHRGKNLGSAMSLNTVFEATEKKADVIFLQTEHKSTNEKFYKKLGFSTKFLGTAFALDKLAYGAKQAVNVCVKVKPDDRVTVITDKKTKNVAGLVIKEIKKVTENLEVFVLEDYGKRPFQIPDFILEKIKNSDAVFVIADYVFGEIPTFYRPLNECVEKNKLIMASMVELNKQLLSEGMNADYEKIREFSKQVFNAVKDSKEIQVTTELGTDFSLRCRHNWAILDGFPTPGKWVNLPDGEVLTAPTELNGKIVIDGVAEFLGVLSKNPLTVEVKNNAAQKNSVSCVDKKTKEKFIRLVFGSDENSCKIGEFAFGTNLFLKKLCGNLTQDEKFPSVHVAFGDPHGSLTGANWKSKLHMDAVILKPTVFADGKKIMEKGKYVL